MNNDLDQNTEAPGEPTREDLGNRRHSLQQDYRRLHNTVRGVQGVSAALVVIHLLLAALADCLQLVNVLLALAQAGVFSATTFALRSTADPGTGEDETPTTVEKKP